MIFVNFNSLLPVRNKNFVPSFYQFEFFTCSHFVNNLVITPKLSLADGIFYGSKEAEI